MADRARKRNNRIDYSLVNDILPVRIEEAWMNNVFYNLLENALKYSWKDQEVVVAAEESADGVIQIQVKNWGVGIPQAHYKRIFFPYFRSRIPDEKELRLGTGLGLAIVKHAVEVVHSGRVEVDSHPYQSGKAESSTEEDMKGIEHETCFKIELNRRVLSNLSLKRGVD
jgi:signal transduction histidine kinase